MKKPSSNRILRKTVAVVASAALALSMFGTAGCATVELNQNTDRPRYASQVDATIGDEAAPLADGANTLEIKAGAAVKGTGNTYSWPNLKVIASDPSKLIYSITVQFTSAITAADEITFSDSGNFKVFDKTKHGNKSVNNENGATAAEWEAYLSQNMVITLANDQTSQSLRMIASYNKVDAIYDYWSGNGHYYKYVYIAPPTSGTIKTSVSWEEALEAAAADTYLGMKGYLVTVTSKEEHAFISSLINSRTWIGGTCWDKYISPWSSAATTAKNYYWVTGPEAGTPISIGSTAVNGAFTYWASGEPNNSQSIGYTDRTLTVNLGEYCIHMYDSSNNYLWNDYPAFPSTSSHYVQGYIVEYGDMPEDDNDSSVDVNVDVDVDVKIDIELDPSGQTLTTDVNDGVVGSPLAISENVNGDENIVSNIDGKEQPADITRTFQIQNADGSWSDVPESQLGEDGNPIHAGTYKVTSSAVYSQTGSGTPVYYKTSGATFTIKPKPIVPEFTKVYDGTTDLNVSAIDIADQTLEGADVTMTADAAAAFNDPTVAGAHSVALTGAKLSGADAGDYTLSGVGENGSFTAKGTIVPRDLVLTATSNVNWGLAGTALKAADGSDPAYKTNLAIHGTGDWAEYELAARDAVNGDVQNTILGQLSFSALSGSTPLDIASPVKGLYGLSAHYANVNPAEGDTLSQKSTVRLMAEGDEEAETPSAPAPATGGLDAITAKKLDDGRYDIGNYILTLKGANVLITDDPGAEDAYDDATKFISGVVNNEVDEDASPLSPDEILDLIRQIAGADLPEGTPNIQIFKNGEPVDTIDPSELGSYAIVATYPNPDGEDEVVRVGYNVLQSQPFVMNENVTVATSDDADPVTKADLKKLAENLLPNWLPSGVTPSVVIVDENGHQISEIDLSVPGTYNVTLTYIDENGVAKEVDLTYTVKADADATIVEDVSLPIDPNATPISPDDVVKRIEDTYPGLIPDGLEPHVTITKDGQTVDSIDPTQPGTYEVTIDYIDPETGEVVKTVKTTYTFVEDPAAGDSSNSGDGIGDGVDGIDDENGLNGDGSEGNGNGSNGTGNPGSDGTNGSAGSAGNGTGSSTTSGAKGFNDVASRLLAQTGDPVFWVVCGIVVVAVVAGVVLVVSRRKNKQ